MLRLHLVVIDGAFPGPLSSLPGFDVRVAPFSAINPPGPLPDVVVVVTPPSLEEAADACAAIGAQLCEEMVPLVLAIDGADQLAPEGLETLEADALVDVRWSRALLSQALAMAVARVRSGRGVAAIQQQVLGAVRREVLQLRDLSIRDGMTGLYNFRFFREVLAREHYRCERYARPYAVVCFDLDHLRELNNTYGHELGTRALTRVGLTLATTARTTDFAFRIGGDEFAVLLLECDRAQAAQYAERVRTAIRQSVIEEAGVRVPLTVSAGIASFPEDGGSLEGVLRRADALLYRAKDLGRDRVVAVPSGANTSEVA